MALVDVIETKDIEQLQQVLLGALDMKRIPTVCLSANVETVEVKENNASQMDTSRPHGLDGGAEDEHLQGLVQVSHGGNRGAWREGRPAVRSDGR